MSQTTAVMQGTMQLLCHHQTGTYSATHGTVGSHVNDGPTGGYVHSASCAAEIIVHNNTHLGGRHAARYWLLHGYRTSTKRCPRWESTHVWHQNQALAAAHRRSEAAVLI